MSLAEIEEKVIRPLTKAEKWQLIKDIQQMLEEDEVLSKYFQPGQKVGRYTPVIEPKIAKQLAEMLKK